MYNLRQDPFETFDSIRDRSDIIQTKQWINEPMQKLLGSHIKSLMDYPPVQKAATFDFSEVIKNMQNQKK